MRISLSISYIRYIVPAELYVFLWDLEGMYNRNWLKFSGLRLFAPAR